MSKLHFHFFVKYLFIQGEKYSAICVASCTDHSLTLPSSGWLQGKQKIFNSYRYGFSPVMKEILKGFLKPEHNACVYLLLHAKRKKKKRKEKRGEISGVWVTGIYFPNLNLNNL